MQPLHAWLGSRSRRPHPTPVPLVSRFSQRPTLSPESRLRQALPFSPRWSARSRGTARRGMLKPYRAWLGPSRIMVSASSRSNYVSKRTAGTGLGLSAALLASRRLTRR